MKSRSATVFETAERSPSGILTWRTAPALGCIVGATIATLDFLYYFPLVSAPNEIGFGLFVSSLVVWCGECALFALALAIAERLASPDELRPWQLGLALVGGVTASVIAWHAFSMLVLRDQLGMHLFRDHVGQPENWIGGMLYHAWLMFFFGGLIAAVGTSHRRRTRMLLALRSAELNRAISQHRLAEARLASLEARVDPTHLYRTLSRLERLYEDDPTAADRLLDELIVFLRCALNDSQATKPKLEAL
ncbi:MAG: hypothetical protein GEV05_26660 [Betaproteobacteria bacterium]|nr:hypothetical protein [Betaproteobacteria bacterium]